MSNETVYPVSAAALARTHLTREQYEERYRQSLADPDGFWAAQAQEFVSWFRPWERVANWDFTEANIRWFEGAELNVAYNCVDRHLESRGDQVAILWEGDNPADSRKVTYRELHEAISRLGNALKARGVKKGDRVSIYMPMIPEATVAMLACARIGAVHSVVFGGFSPEALKDRILDSDCQVVITADEGLRGGRPVPLKANTDRALAHCPNVHTVFVVKRTGGAIDWSEGRDVWFEQAVAAASADCPQESVD